MCGALAGRQAKSESAWLATCVLLWEHWTVPRPADCLLSACGGRRCFCHTVKSCMRSRRGAAPAAAVAAARV